MPDQKEKPHKTGIHEIKLSRVEALVDGVFGFAMTLLVLNLVISRGLSLTELDDVLAEQIDNIAIYVLSFLILANFWIVINRDYVHMKSSNTIHVWLTVFMLMFVALMPFSTLVLAEYYSAPLAEVFFAANVILVGGFLTAGWFYATRQRHLVEPYLDHTTIRLGIVRGLLIPGVGLIVIAAAVFIPEWSPLFYLLILLVHLVPVLHGK